MSRFCRLFRAAVWAAVVVAAAGKCCWAAWGEPSAAEKKILNALNSPTELEFIDTPLQDVVDYLKNLHEIEIQIDWRAFDDVGIGADNPITRNLKGVSLRSALRLVLGDLDLTFIVRDEVLLITTSEVAESWPITRVYPVDDLLGGQRDPTSRQTGCESLFGAITATIDPNSWIHTRGQHAISAIPPQPTVVAGIGPARDEHAVSAIPPRGPKSLVVRHNDRIQEQIADLMVQLREAAGRKAGRDPWAAARRSLAAAAEKKIGEALDSPTELEFIETPLQDVIDYLKDRHEIEIQIDGRAFDDVGIGTDTPITKNLKKVSLRSALRLLLRDLDLTYVIRYEVLLITTPEEAQSGVSVRVYPLSRLTADGATAEWTPADGDALVETITAAIAPDTWRLVGGPGTIAPLWVGKLRALVVGQTSGVHREIAELLARPEFREAQPPASPKPKAADRPKPRHRP